MVWHVYRETEKEKQRKRRRDRQRGGDTERQKDRETKRLRDRQRGNETEKQEPKSQGDKFHGSDRDRRGADQPDSKTDTHSRPETDETYRQTDCQRQSEPDRKKIRETSKQGISNECRPR